jgi:hypothetical protein
MQTTIFIRNPRLLLQWNGYFPLFRRAKREISLGKFLKWKEGLIAEKSRGFAKHEREPGPCSARLQAGIGARPRVANLKVCATTPPLNLASSA